MNLAKKIMFVILLFICCWALGLFAFLNVQSFDYLLNVVGDKQSLLQEKKYVENNLEPMTVALQEFGYSDKVKQFNIDENVHFINLYNKITSKYQEEALKRLNENYGSEMKTIKDYIILGLVMCLIVVFCVFILYLSIKWNWFFGVLIALLLAFFPIVHFLLNFKYWSVNKVLSQRMVEDTKACMAKTYAEKSNCIETLNFLNELQVKRAFIKEQMKQNKHPFFFAEQDKEVDKVKFKSKNLQQKGLDAIKTVINNQENNSQTKGCFIPNPSNWGGFYYVNLK